MANKKVEKSDISFLVEPGSMRNLIVSWKFTYKVDGKDVTDEKTLSYDWEWDSYINGKWVDRQTGSTTHPLVTARFTAPDNAEKIRFRVRPLSKTNEDTDLSGVDKDTDSDTKVKHYFTGEWSSWVPFDGWTKTTNPPSFKPHVEIGKKLTAQGTKLLGNIYITQNEYDKFLPYWASVEFVWKAFDGRDWTDLTSGTYTLMEGALPKTDSWLTPTPLSNYKYYYPAEIPDILDIDDPHTYDNVEPSDIFVYAQNAYKQYKLEIQPVPLNDYAFLPQKSSDVTKKTILETRVFNTKDIHFTEDTVTGDIVARLEVRKGSDILKNISGFTVQWGYFESDSPSILASEWQWIDTSEENIAEDDRDEINLDFGYYNPLILNGSSVVPDSDQPFDTDEVGAFTIYQWHSIFSFPDGVPADRQLRFRVKVNVDDKSSFKEEYSPWVYYTKSLKHVQIDPNAITITPYSSTTSARSLLATWTVKDVENFAGFAYNWFYQFRTETIWRPGQNGTVELTQTTQGTYDYKEIKERNASGENPFYWQMTYDAPNDATSVMLEIKPAPSFSGAFKGETSRLIHGITIPTKTVDGTINVYVYNAANREIRAEWLNLPDEEVQSYECLWEYYFLDRWHNGQSNSTSRDSVSEPGDTTTTVSLESSYTAPAEASSVRFTVRPNASSTDIFKGEWANYVVIPTRPTTLQLNPEYFSIKRQSQASRTLTLKYTGKDTIPTDLDPVTGQKMIQQVGFEWSYYLDGDWWLDSGTHTTSVDYLNDTFEVPEYAEKVRVRGIPDVDNLTYKGEWSSEYVEFPIEIPVRKPETVWVEVFRRSERSVIGIWQLGDMTDVEDFTVQWRYYENGYYFTESESNVSVDDMHSLYSVPEKSTLVGMRVKANPKYELSFKEDEWTDWYDLEVGKNNIPEQIETPTVTIDANTSGYAFTATVNTTDTKTGYVEFQVVTDSNENWYTSIVDVIYDRATFQFPVESGMGYRVRARALNWNLEADEESDNQGWSSYSSPVYSKPAQPTITRISALSTTSVEVVWTPVMYDVHVERTYTVQYAQKEIYFDSAPSQVQSVNGLIYETLILGVEGNPLAAGDWFFKVRADAGSLYSEWSKIASISIGKPAGVPTTWSSRLTARVGDDIYLYWTHNAEDGSAEKYADLKVIVNGVQLEIDPIEKLPDDTSQSSYKLPDTVTAEEATIEWSVRTMGAYPAYSDWATQRVIKVYSPPSILATLSLSAEERKPVARNTITTFPINVFLDSAPASQTPIAYVVSITANSTYTTGNELGTPTVVTLGQEIYSKHLNTNEKHYVLTISPGDIALENGENYILTATVAMDSGLTASYSINFTVDWGDEEFDIDAEFGFDYGRYIAYIRPFCNRNGDGAVSNATLAVYRREFDGAFTKIADNISNLVRPTITDPHPTLDYARYRVTATSPTTGRVSYYDIPAYKIGVTSIILQWDEAQVHYDAVNNIDEYNQQVMAGSMIKLPYNVDTSDSNTMDIEMVEYIGRSHPVSYYGTQVGQKATWNALIPKTDKQTIYDLRRLARYLGDVYVREPSGTGYWAHVEVSFSLTHNETTVPVQLSVTRVEGGV